MIHMATGRDRTNERAQTGITRVAILQSLRQAEEPMTVQQLADQLRLHPTSIRFHLTRLVHADLVREDQAGSAGPGRPRLIYTAVTAPAPDPSSGHQLLAEALAEHLAHAVPNPGDVATEAGEERGRQMVSRDADPGPVSEDEAKAEITALMQDNGFDPQWDADSRRLWLRTCPFRPLADQQPAVACSVHLGLMRGALAALDAPIEVASLEASAAPHPCLAVFVPRTLEEATQDGTGSRALSVSPSPAR